MIKVTGLKKIYNDKTVINDFNYEFKDESFYVITGESGCGKTTFLHMLLGLVIPDGGNVAYEGGSREKQFGVLFQEDRLIENLSSIENVRIVADNPDKERIKNELLKILPGECISKPVRELSGGMKRRVSLIRAFSHGSVVMLDEPFAGLDEENRKNVADYIKNNSAGKTLIIATHEAELLPFCEEIKLRR